MTVAVEPAHPRESVPPDVRRPTHAPRQLARPVVWGRAPRLDRRRLLRGSGFASLAMLLTWRAWTGAWGGVDPAGENSHILLAPLVIVWLAWVRRKRVPHVRVSGRWLGPLIVLAGWTFAAFGLYRNFAWAFYAGALLGVIGTFVSVCGKGTILRFMPVVGATLFLLPVPDALRLWTAEPIRSLSAATTAAVARLTGADATADRGLLIVEGRLVSQADPATGVAMMMGLLVLTYAVAFAWPMRNSVRWLLLAMTPVVAFGCEVLRNLLLLSGPDDGTRWLHLLGGWMMLPLAAVLLVLLVRVLRWFDVPIERYRLASR